MPPLPLPPQPSEAPPTKRPWRSKTYWTNILIATALPLLPQEVQVWINQHPLLPAETILLLNLILRKVSHGKITLR